MIVSGEIVSGRPATMLVAPGARSSTMSPVTAARLSVSTPLESSRSLRSAWSARVPYSSVKMYTVSSLATSPRSDSFHELRRPATLLEVFVTSIVQVPFGSSPQNWTLLSVKTMFCPLSRPLPGLSISVLVVPDGEVRVTMSAPR